MLRPLSSALLAFFVAALALPEVARAAETDQYYAWLYPVPDSTDALTRAVNLSFETALSRVNRRGDADALSCFEVAREMTAPFFSTGYWFFVGSMKHLGFSYAPASNTEYRERYRPVSVYRYAPTWLLGLIVPLDPTLRIDGVNLGTDKLGHFFPNGQRYYERFREEKGRGRSDQQAIESAVRFGVEQEKGILGGLASGIFSFADLEANYQGLRFFRALCDGDRPLLTRDEEGWRLLAPFDFRAYVNPCWDETFNNNAYFGGLWPSVKQGLERYCRVRARPEVTRLVESYARRGCRSESVRLLASLRARGEVPDARRYSLDAACADLRSRGGG